MDRKDLELLVKLHECGIYDPEAIAPLLSITPANVVRRVSLLIKEGVLQGFSAFFDRRSFGYDTSFLKVHFPNRRKAHVLEGIRRLTSVASIYPNIDDFAIIEVVHRNTSSLNAIIGSVESLLDTCTVSAAYVPRLPDAVPDPGGRVENSVLLELVRDGAAPAERIARMSRSSLGSVERSITALLTRKGVRVHPMVSEEEITPFPCFSFFILIEDAQTLPAILGHVGRLASLRFMMSPMARPPAIWMRCFGDDLHAMDHMLERIRRIEGVEDSFVILPDGVENIRAVDEEIIIQYMARRVQEKHAKGQDRTR